MLFFVDIFCCLVFVIIVITRSGSISPSSKKRTFENPKGNVRKKTIVVKPEVDNTDSQSMKRKQPVVASHRKNAKA